MQITRTENLITASTPDWNLTVELLDDFEIKTIGFDGAEHFDWSVDDVGFINGDNKFWNGEYLVDGKRLDDLVAEVTK